MRIVQAVSISVFLLFSMAIVCAWASDDGQDKKTISGTVTDADWVKSIITFRYSQPFTADADEVNLIVSPETKITRGSSTISLSDIGQSDPVTVAYYDSGFSGLKAIRISDLNQASN